MSLLPLFQAAMLLLLALGGFVVVKIRDPLRQTLALSFYGFLLALLFVAFEAPDVALSAIIVGAVALPLMILLALGKIREARP